MNTRFSLRFVPVLVVMISFIAVAYAGGWSLVTVKDFPDFAVAGESFNLTFTAWVPSLDPLPALHPVVHATNTKGRTVRVNGGASGAEGEYTAALTLPEPGVWVIALDTEYKNAAILPAITVVAPGSLTPNPLPLASRGMRLFIAKGCNGCHLHPDVKEGRVYGPDLEAKRFNPEYLRRFLADPSITQVPDEVCSKDRNYCGSPYAMPKLNLKDAEIEALVAFLTKK